MLKTAYISTIELRKLLWECADLERDGWTEEGYLRRLHAENEHYISINTTV